MSDRSTLASRFAYDVNERKNMRLSPCKQAHNNKCQINTRILHTGEQPMRKQAHNN